MPDPPKAVFPLRQAAVSQIHDTNIRDQYHYTVNNCARGVDVHTVCMYIGFMYLIACIYVYFHAYTHAVSPNRLMR